ncbi:unnamed protein product [Prorocentrum cordatum]|uniref:Uncharacterized protein n=1 Tax=Prorocentrum cordatum TaxID=2364126 RepID=A0ABN9RSX8_9DINO|nr:unnamed protein product [Polarella glacialis]
MLNHIPGIYITGEHVVTDLLRTKALLGLAAPSGARGEVTGLESSDYHREVYVFVARQVVEGGKGTQTRDLNEFYNALNANDSRRAYWITLEDFKNGSTEKFNDLLGWIGFSRCRYTKVHAGKSGNTLAQMIFSGGVSGHCVYRRQTQAPALQAPSRDRHCSDCGAAPVEEPLCDPCRGDRDFVFILGSSDAGLLAQASLNQVPGACAVGAQVLSKMLSRLAVSQMIAKSKTESPFASSTTDHRYHMPASVRRQQRAVQSFLKARMGAFSVSSTRVIGSTETGDPSKLNFSFPAPCARFALTSGAPARSTAPPVSPDRIFQMPALSADALNDLLVWLGFSDCRFGPSSPGASMRASLQSTRSFWEASPRAADWCCTFELRGCPQATQVFAKFSPRPVPRSHGAVRPTFAAMAAVAVGAAAAVAAAASGLWRHRGRASRSPRAAAPRAAGGEPEALPLAPAAAA